MVVSTTPDPVARTAASVTGTSPTIETNGLRVGYWRDEVVLSSLTMRLSGPGWFGLAGPNGSGKSTLFEALAGYLEPMAGDIVMNGHRVVAGRRNTSMRLARADPAFVPGVTIRDHLHLYAKRYRRTLADLVSMADTLGLAAHLDKAPHSLSTGSLKKAWFVCTWAGTESVWCLDEPFNGVDSVSTQAMVMMMAARARTALVITTSHLLPEGLQAVPSGEQYVSPPFTLEEIRRV